MPIIYQKFIYRDDMRANPGVFYVFGDNVERIGFGGQAKEMRGEPNAIGVATKWRSGMAPGDFFYDEEFGVTGPIINSDFKRVVEALEHGALVVLPLDGIGTGYSRLPELAPQTYAYILEWFEHLKRIPRL